MRRLGLDIGTNSIGWCLIEDDSRIVDAGVRIFSDGRDPKSGASLAVDRREARSARRRRDRYLGRRAAFLKTLVEHGMMPADADEARLVAERDPYTIRARALDEALDPHDIGRALFHLNQRRGFKSNRKAERRAKENEDGKIATGAKALDAAMHAAAARTLGEFLAGRLAAGQSARVRMGSDAQGYDFYPQRDHVEQEFGAIWDAQVAYHPDLLTQTARAAIHRILFFQRELKEQKVGLCAFSDQHDVPSTDQRLAKAHPLFQERRLYEEVNHLQITTPGEQARPLSMDQREKLILLLRDKGKRSFSALGKAIGLEPGQSFNKASETRTDLEGNAVFATMVDKKRFGDRWKQFDDAQRWVILDRVMEEKEPARLHHWLMETYGVSEDQADAIGRASLPEGHGRLGETATRRILDELKRDVIPYSEAVARCGWHHSDKRTGEEFSKLPYYGRILTSHIPPGSFDAADNIRERQEIYWGKITNPTVHIGLRQLEKLVNAVIAVHGRPDQIVVELARELKLNEKDKEEHNRRIRRDTAAAQLRSAKLQQEGVPDTGANRMLLRLWEDLNPANPLDRRCPYCGDPIGMRALFSGEADVDHIIPYSRSLDDSAGNKVVAHRNCNRAKGNRTPHEQWGGNAERWETISAQVARMHRSKQWRFGPDAMERVERDGGFVARQLTDTQYLSRIAGDYLRSLYPTKEDGRVYVIPGRMTAMLRRLWALNDLLDDHRFVDNKNSNAPKNRLDHRHHMIDAFVCAVTSERLLQLIARAAGRAEDKDLDRLFEGLPEPWPGYLDDLRAVRDRITVSHKPDHGRRGRPAPGRDVTAGRLHNDTAYGLTGDFAPDGKTPIVVHRVPLISLKPGDFTSPDRIADPVLRDALFEATRDRSGKEFEQALARIQRDGIAEVDRNGDRLFKGLRHVRVREPLSVIAVRDKSGRPYKAYKGDANARYDVWRMPDGKWRHDIVPMFDAHQPAAADRRPHPAAKKMLSLRQNDVLAIEREGQTMTVRVVKFSTNGQIALAPPNEAGPLKGRDAAADDPFKYIYATGGSLKKLKARQVRIDPLGRVFDPGPRE